MRWWDRHLVAAAIHAISFAALLAAAHPLSDHERKFYWSPGKWALGPRTWYFTCAAAGTAPADCEDKDKQFYVTPPADAVYVNAIVLASSYALWSAFAHMAVWALRHCVGVNAARELRWGDYVYTAPTMLAVVGLVFGSESITAVCVAPGGLAMLLAAAAVLERRQDECPPQGGRCAAIVGLFLLYPFVLVPALWAAWEITVETTQTVPGQPNVGIGTAPDFVFAFAVFTAVAFTSFGGVYAVDAVTPLKNREAVYVTLSLIAKTTLHLFLGISVIGQSRSVGVAEPDPEASSEMDDLATGLGGAAALVVGISVINAYAFPTPEPGYGALVEQALL